MPPDLLETEPLEVYITAVPTVDIILKLDEQPEEFVLLVDGTKEANIADIVDSYLIELYIKDSTYLKRRLGVYRDRAQAIAHGLESGDLYFNWNGQLVRNKITNMTLNFRRAFSFLRRLF